MSFSTDVFVVYLNYKEKVEGRRLCCMCSNYGDSIGRGKSKGGVRERGEGGVFLKEQV
jgi:hypothetical protein